MSIRKTNGPPANPQLDRAARHLGRQLARRALREVFNDPKMQEQDKALTDKINGYFGGHVNYGADGYEGVHVDQSRTSIKKSDRRLTDAINQTFGAHLSYTHMAHTQNAKEAGYAKAGEELINNTINSIGGKPQGTSIDDMIGKLTGGNAPSTDPKAQTQAMDNMIANMFGKPPADGSTPAPAPAAPADDAAIDDLLKKLSS